MKAYHPLLDMHPWLVRASVCAAALLGAGRAPAATIAQWDLDGNLGAATGQADLVPAASSPAAAAGVTFEAATIRGAPAQVARFTRGTIFRVRPGFAANGGGEYVNQFTVILDVMFPDRSPSGGWAALLQTNDANENDGDWFVDPSGGIGISGSYGGAVANGEWRRLGLVVDLVAGTLKGYVDGAPVQLLEGQALDGRFSLYATSHGQQQGFWLFADDSGENAAGYVDAIQTWDTALCDEDLAAIGSLAAGPLLPTYVPQEACAPPPPPPFAIKEGPYLQWATLSEITVMWETSVAADTTVFYRRTGGDWIGIAGAPAVKIHEVRLGGFDADELVEYYVLSRNGEGEVQSPVSTFRTNPPEPVDFGFVVWGDSHVNPPVFRGLVERMDALAPGLAMSCGDVVNTGSNYAEWGQGLLTPLQPLGKHVPFYIAIGNHEGNSHWFYDYMAQPGNEHWFSFDYAGCHFVVFDSNFPFGPTSLQYKWLQADLFSEAAQNAKWLFAFHHHPAYSELIEETIYAQLRAHIVPLLESAGVDVDFTGHIHDYERGIYVPPDTGRRIAYVQTSGAGGRLWEDEYDGDWEQIEKVVQFVYHFCDVQIAGNKLTLRAIGSAGQVIDSFELEQLPRTGEPPDPPPPPDPGGEAITQWDFDGGDLQATWGPGLMTFLGGDGGATAQGAELGTTTSLGIPGIGGAEAIALKLPKSSTPFMGLRIEPKAKSNGLGRRVDLYSLVFDLLIPSSSFGAESFLALFNASPTNADDAEAFVRLSTGGVGAGNQYHGRLQADTWHRVALVVDRVSGSTVLRKYIDGALAGSQAFAGTDPRWSLETTESATPWFLLFADDDGQSAECYVSSVLFADRVLTAGDVEELGGPDADGIAACAELAGCQAPFRRGDGNGDGAADLSDAVFTLVYLFAGGVEAHCLKAIDANDDGALEITDAIFELGFLFLGTPDPPAPYPACGEDETEDVLTCAQARGCSG